MNQTCRWRRGRWGGKITGPWHGRCYWAEVLCQRFKGCLMAQGQHTIQPALCFFDCRLALSEEADEYTSYLLDRLRDWPWIGEERIVDGKTFRVISHPPEDGGYMLVFDITEELLVRPVVVFDGVTDEAAVLSGLGGLITMLAGHAMMVAIESGH